MSGRQSQLVFVEVRSLLSYQLSRMWGSQLPETAAPALSEL